MVSTTSQINKVVEFIAVLGDLIILNLCLFFLLFFWEEALYLNLFLVEFHG